MKMRTQRDPWLLVIVALALALAGQLLAQRIASAAAPNADRQMDVIYRFRPQTLSEGRDRASVIVLAEVASVARGTDIVTPLQKEPKSEKRLPTQRITLNVLKVYRGQVTPGQRVTLRQTGGNTDNSSVSHFARENPQYRQGERYVLLLEPTGQESLFRIIAPEGRFRLERGDLVTPMVDNAVTQNLRGKPLAYLEQLLAAP